MPPLTPKRRSELRAAAHKLSPTVLIGDKGLTDEVLAEIDRALKAHELIKVRAASDDRDARNVWMESICGKLEAHPVQQIGKVLVVFRENPPEKPDSRPLPRARAADEAKRGGTGRKEASATRKRREDDEVKRTSRPRSRTPSPRPESAPRRRRPRTSR